MDFSTLFHTLLTSSSKSSPLTVKNYVSDLRNFIRWFEDTYNTPFDPTTLTEDVITAFKSEKTLAPASKDRRISAVKKFLHLLAQEGANVPNLFPQPSTAPLHTDPWKIREFRHFLHLQKSAPVTVKNYMLDVEAFSKWYSLTYAPIESINAVNSTAVQEYKNRLIHVLQLSPASVNRKMSSLRKYFSFQHLQTKVDSVHSISPDNPSTLSLADLIEQEITEQYSSVPPIRLFQKLTSPIKYLEDHFSSVIARSIRNQPSVRSVSPQSTPVHDSIRNIPKEFYNPQGLSTKNWSFPKKLLHHLRYTRPAWYRKYHTFPHAPKLHMIIFVLFTSVVAVYVYNSLYENPSGDPSILGTQTHNTRLITLSGTLKNSDQKIISQPQKVTFGIYSHPQNHDTKLWQEVRTITPTEDGTFTIALGEISPLSNDLFSNGSNLYLGIAIGNSPELQPRRALANTPLADDTLHVQGLTPITSQGAGAKNVLLALNSSGNLEIGGSSSPEFRATNGEFTLSGNSVVLETNPGSGGSIIFSPDNHGAIDLQGAIQNNSELGLFPGSVHIQDSLVIDASQSAQTALRVTTSGTGDLLSVDSFGSTHFSIKSSGNIGMGTDQPDALLDVRGSLAVSGTTRFNNLNYVWPTISGVKGSVLVDNGSGTLTWVPSENIEGASFTLNNGAIQARNTMHDLLIGGSSTESAKFGFINMASGNPTAQFAGNLTFTGDRVISSTSMSPLTFGTSQTGAITFQNAGNIGIGLSNPTFKFDVKDVKDTTVITRFYNASTGSLADGIAIRLGNTSMTTPNTNTFIKFETDGLGVVGAVSGNGAGGVTFATNGPADFAEYLEKDPHESIEYGSLVCLASSGFVTQCGDNGVIIGVASNNPAFVGGNDLGERSIAVGMVGQIRVKVSTANGHIQPGDPITSSHLEGIGTKALNAQYIVGRALESSENSTDGKVLVLVQPSWFDPDLALNTTGQLSNIDITAVSQLNPLLDTTNSSYIVRRAGTVITRIGTYAQASIGILHAGVIETQKVIISGTLSAQNTITKQLSVTTDNILISGKHLREYIIDTVKSSDNLFEPTTGQNVAYGEAIKTLMISPLVEDSQISVSLSDSKLTVRNGSEATSSAVTEIDNQGNFSTQGSITAPTASISGQVTSESIYSSTASISGTLTADKIIAGSLELSTLSHEFINLATMSAQFALINESFISLGTATFREATVLDSFSIGTGFIFGTNSINTLGQDLEIQPLRQGALSLMAGSLVIATDGTITFGENATFAKNVAVQGTLATNILAPLPDQDLAVHLDKKIDGQGQSFSVQNGSKSPVFSVNDGGDVVSSGSAYFGQNLVASGSALLSKLNIFSSPVEAVSDTEVVASGSAGLATLKQGKREVTIYTPSVSADSLIYITPVGNTNNQVLYLGRQVPGESFTVGIAETANRNIPFNWIIVN